MPWTLGWSRRQLGMINFKKRKEKEILEPSALINIELWEGILFALYFRTYGANWTDFLLQRGSDFPRCGQYLFRVIGKLLIHVWMFEIPVRPLHWELRLRREQQRLLGSEKSCGLLLKTLRGNLKKAVAVQEVACVRQLAVTMSQSYDALHLEGTLTCCGKVWVGFFSSLLWLTEALECPLPSSCGFFEQMSKSLWVWSDPKCL